LYTDVKKLCPAEMPLRRRVSIDSSRGMSEDSSEDEDTRNQNITNKLKTNHSIDQISVSKLILLKLIVFYSSVNYLNSVPERN